MQTNTIKTILLILIISLIGLIFGLYLDSRQLNVYSEITFLDVGQGDAILVKTKNNKYGLIDTGKELSGYIELEKTLPNNIHQLDFLVITHTDLDHYGTIFRIIENYKVKNLFINKSPKENFLIRNLSEKIGYLEIEQFELLAGQSFQFQEYKFTVLWPNAEKLRENNDSNSQSIALLVSKDDFDLLTMGDLESQSEIESTKEITEDIDVLKVSHHGSGNSTSFEFVQDIQPKASIIQVGKENTYGHPTSKVIENLENNGVKIYRNDALGTIKLRIFDSNYKINKDNYSFR